MPDDSSINDDGADPTADIKAQNPGQTTTGDITKGTDESPTKVQDLTHTGEDGDSE